MGSVGRFGLTKEAAVELVLIPFGPDQPNSTRAPLIQRGGHTCKIFHAIVFSRMLATGTIVPFDTKPCSFGAYNLASPAYSAEMTFVRNTTASNFIFWFH